MDLNLSGRRALVTGGTRGIGRAIVTGLLDEGAQVAFCARTAEAVDATAIELADRGRVMGSAVDVGDPVMVAQWVETSAAELGGIDIVVANVSALAIPDMPENWQTSYNVDLMGTVRLVEAALPHLREGNGPSIITISSVSGREIDFTAGPYGVMKAAIVHYTQGLAFNLAGEGIRANTVSPGNTYFEGGVWESIEKGDPDLYNHALGLNPTGRMARPEEIANGVVFLASDRASFVSGTNLVIDGALTRGVQL